MKDPGFTEEEEWRLIGGLYKPHKPRMNRARGSLIIPYQILEFGNNTKINDVIDQVIIGPSADQELSKVSATWLLNSFMFTEGSTRKQADIRQSMVPYRVPSSR